MMEDGVTPRGLIDRVLDSHDEDPTTRINYSKTRIRRTPASQRKRQSPLRSVPTDTTTPRTLIEAFVEGHQTVHASPHKRTRIERSPQAPSASTSPQLSVNKSMNRSLNRSSNKSMNKSLNRSLHKKATMRTMMTAQADYPTPRTMIEAFMAQGPEESAIERVHEDEETMLPPIATGHSKSYQEQDSDVGNSFLDAYHAASQPLPGRAPPSSASRTKRTRHRAVSKAEFGAAVKESIAQLEEDDESLEQSSREEHSLDTSARKSKNVSVTSFYESKGDGNRSKGEGNRSQGEGNRSKGDGNRSKGEGNRSKGDGNRSQGDGNRSQGDGNRSKGDGNRSKGEGNRSKGDGNRSKGNGNRSQGDGNRSRSADVTIGASAMSRTHSKQMLITNLGLVQAETTSRRSSVSSISVRRSPRVKPTVSDSEQSPVPRSTEDSFIEEGSSSGEEEATTKTPSKRLSTSLNKSKSSSKRRSASINMPTPKRLSASAKKSPSERLSKSSNQTPSQRNSTTLNESTSKRLSKSTNQSPSMRLSKSAKPTPSKSMSVSSKQTPSKRLSTSLNESTTKRTSVTPSQTPSKRLSPSSNTPASSSRKRARVKSSPRNTPKSYHRATSSPAHVISNTQDSRSKSNVSDGRNYKSDESIVPPSDTEEAEEEGEVMMVGQVLDENHLEITTSQRGGIIHGERVEVVSIQPLNVTYNTVEPSMHNLQEETDEEDEEEEEEKENGKDTSRTANNTHSLFENNSQQPSVMSMVRGQYDRLQTPVLRTAKSGPQAGDAPALTPFQRLMQAHQLHKTPKPAPKPTPKPTPPAKAKAPGRAVAKKRKSSSSEPPRLPSSLTRSIFSHFLGKPVKKETLAQVEKVCDRFWQNVAGDVAAIAEHAGRVTVDERDVNVLMKRQRMVSEKKSMYTLVEEYLPLQYQRALIPCAKAGNVVTPKPHRS